MRFGLFYELQMPRPWGSEAEEKALGLAIGGYYHEAHHSLGLQFKPRFARLQTFVRRPFFSLAKPAVVTGTN
jgi:hypothetical protein